MLHASIVTYHTPDDELTQCLNSLSDKAFGKVTVIDNSRSASTERICQSSNLPIVYLPSDNIGYGAAHNIALRESIREGADYHLILNPDISFSPDSMQLLTDYMDRNPRAGALQPKIVGTDHRLQYTVRMLPTPFDLISRRFFPKSWFAKKRNRYELRHIDHGTEFNPPYHQGSFMLLRVEALKEAGLFDERFFMYPEDIDLTRRIHARWQTPYVPFVTVVHAHRAGSYHSLRMLRIHIWNMVRYFNKWGWLWDAERDRFNEPFKTRNTDI